MAGVAERNVEWRSVVSSEIARQFGMTVTRVTIVRWIRGHPPQTRYTHQRQWRDGVDQRERQADMK